MAPNPDPERRGWVRIEISNQVSMHPKLLFFDRWVGSKFPLPPPHYSIYPFWGKKWEFIYSKMKKNAF